MSELADLQQQVAQLIDDRDWRQFHDDPKGILMNLGSEVGELMEIYPFTTTAEAKARVKTHTTQVQDEVADILYSLLMFCDECGLDLEQAFQNKFKKIKLKYPIDKHRNVNKKYSEL